LLYSLLEYTSSNIPAPEPLQQSDDISNRARTETSFKFSKMIPKSLTNSDWDVLKLRNDNFVKDNGYSKRILPGAKRKQSNINDFLLAVGSKLSDSKGPYTELVFKPSSTSTPNSPCTSNQKHEMLHKTRSLTPQTRRPFDFPKQRSLSTGNLPDLSPCKSEAVDVLDRILLEQKTLTIKKYLLNNQWVKVLVLEDTEL